MKTALMALVVLSSVNVFASTLNYKVCAPAVVTSQYGVKASDVQFCPQFDDLSVQQAADLKGLSLVFGLQSDIVATKASGASRTCMSDIICPTEDNFDFVNGNGFASIERNNDGNYPTTDLPGYSSLSVYIDAATQTGKVSCYYSIKQQN